MLSTTVNALYVSSRPGAMAISFGSVALALIVGIGVALASALAPAREAGIVPPTEAMARGRRESEVRVERKRDAIIAVVLALLGALAAQAPPIEGKPLLGYLAALLVFHHLLLSPFAPRALTLELFAALLGIGLLRLLPTPARASAPRKVDADG